MSNDQAMPNPEPVEWTPELVSKFWNGMANAGLDDGMAFGRLARRCIHWLIARHLQPGGRHLDYGAGSGEVAAHLIEQGYPFAVMDPAAARLSKADARLAALNGFLGRAGYPVRPEYDAVTCFEVIEHVLDPDFERVCRELAGYVRPDGKLILSCPNSENLALDTVYCPISNKTFHRWQHVRALTPDFVTELFAGLGFEKIVLHQLDFFDGLFEPYLHMMGFLSRPLRSDEIVPLHIHQVVNNIDAIIGGATRILYVGRKRSD